MEAQPTTTWRASLRAALFFFLVAALLLGVVLQEVKPVTPLAAPNNARLLARGGDNMIGSYHLARARGLDPEVARIFVAWAADFYLAAHEVPGSDFRYAISAAICMRTLNQPQTMAELLSPARGVVLDESTKKVMRSLYHTILSPRPAPVAVAQSQEYLRELAAGRLLLADIYQQEGREKEAAALAREAAVSAAPILRRVAVAGAVSGAVVLWGLVGAIVWLVRRVRSRPKTRPAAARNPHSAFSDTYTSPVAAPAPSSERGVGGEEDIPVQHDERSWGAREAIEAVVLFVFLSAVFGVLMAALGSSVDSWSTVPLMLTGLLASGLAVLWVLVVARFRAGLGWRLEGAGSGLLAGLTVAGLVFLPATGLQGLLRILLQESATNDPAVFLLMVPDTVWAKVILLGLVGLVIPALEETLFRGILYGGLRKSWRFWPAALVSGGVFAALHLQPAGVITYLLLGVAFAALFERTRSLVAPWAAHAAFNICGLLLLFVQFG